MSVAFRREGDDEHLEPKFELPIPPGPNFVTARGLELIGEQIAALKARIAELSDEIALKPVKRDLRYWQTRLSTAQLVPAADGERVAIGTTVSFILREKSKTISIVGDDQADPAKSLLSFSAPIVRAMMGRSRAIGWISPGKMRRLRLCPSPLFARLKAD